MADTLKTYSVVINWADNTDQGDYGDVVKARDERHAERIVRAHMIWTHWRDHRDPDESRRESLSSYDDGSGEYFGSLVSCTEGAIWKANELEAALRLALPALVAAYGEPTMPEPTALESVKGREAILAARKLLAEIDGIA